MIEHRYRAFISYSHRDKAVATWLHRALETFRTPAKLVGRETPLGPAPRRLTPIFRDRDELPASGDLSAELTAALQASLFMIVICSPAAARSRWVDAEIMAFKRAHGEGRVLALIVDGSPGASDPERECFPPGLKVRLGPDGQIAGPAGEPIAADLRAQGDGRRLAKLKLVAGLTGLRLDDLVQREAQRRLQTMALVASGSAFGATLAVGLAVYANAQRLEAEEKQRMAEAASEFLENTFQGPRSENPKSITAEKILRAGAARARKELSGQPVLQARLYLAFGRAYNNLGMLDEARSMLERSGPYIRQAGPAGAGPLLMLANTYLKQGKVEAALATVRRAEGVLGPDRSREPGLRGLAARIEGDARTAEADVKGGLAAYDRALGFFRGAPKVKEEELGIVLNNRGRLLTDAGQFDAAEKSLLEAKDIFTRVLGERDIYTAQAWSALALNAFVAGKMPLAEQRIARALAVQRAVLEPDNPSIADTVSLQGQIYQGGGKLALAANTLREAIDIYRRAYKGPHYSIGVDEVYLGLIESDLGHTERALAILDDAKLNYDASYGKLHANHGDLLVNRAKVLAKAGRRQEAQADCGRGLEILRQTMGAEAPFTRSMAAECAKL